MKLFVLPQHFSVCKLKSITTDNLKGEYAFLAKAGGELSLVCATEYAPADAIETEHGWRGLKLDGPLDFSLVGILAKIATLLAEAGISIFAISTFDTDYVLVKGERLDAAVGVLQAGGYTVVD